MKKLLASLAVAAIVAAPLAGIAAGEDESDLTIPLSEIGEANVYVDVETTSVWQESNGVPGLQTEAFEGDDENDPYDADTNLLG